MDKINATFYEKLYQLYKFMIPIGIIVVRCLWRWCFKDDIRPNSLDSLRQLFNTVVRLSNFSHRHNAYFTYCSRNLPMHPWHSWTPPKVCLTSAP